MSTLGLPTATPLEGLESPPVARSQRIFTAVSILVLLVVDVCVVSASFLASYLVRFAVSDTVAGLLSFDQYLGTSIVIGLLCALLLALQGLADLDRGRSWPTRLRAILSAVSTALVAGVVLTLDQDQRLSRAWLAVGWTLAITGLVVWRAAAPAAHIALRRHLATRPRLLVVGANLVGQELARELAGQYEVIGYVDNGADLDGALDRPLLAPIAELDSVVRAHGVDEIIIALPRDRREQVDRIIARGFGRPVDVKLLAEYSELLPHRLEVGRFGSRAYIGFAPVARVTWVKRAADVLLGSLAVILAAPLLIGIAIAIKLDTRGPVFYRQRRLGKDGRPFEMLKFRSMCIDAEHMLTVLRDRNEASGPLFKIRRDPRVTRVGRILRRLSLDELPQLLNVVTGSMSLVGPRPPLPTEVEKYEEWQLGRLQARPGMTGLWQVSGRSDVPFNDMVRLDLHYVRNWSIGLDLEIMLRTIPAVLANRGAY
jgi:exopolysaccharide biosynthesis polyprenyl glycosylphosphotransferase